MRRWTARYTFAWTPIVTFGLKRLKFLEWIDQNLEPVSFSEAPDHVGVAPKDHDLRLTVRHNRMTISDGAANPEAVSSLLPTVAAVLSSFEPQSTVLSSAVAAWSLDTGATDYEVERARFAQYQAGGFTGGPLRAADSATLLDLFGADYTGQVEFGIVSGDELKERLASPELGRIKGRPEGKLGRLNDRAFPAVSLFADLHLRPSEPEILVDRSDVEAELQDVDAVGGQFVTALAEQIFTRQESTHDVH